MPANQRNIPTTVTIKNIDGSTQVVDVSDENAISDPELKKDIQLFKSATKLKVLGSIIKKKK